MKKRMHDSKLGTSFVVTGLLHMVEDEGLTPHQAFEIVEDIKQQTFFALAEAHREKRGTKE